MTRKSDHHKRLDAEQPWRRWYKTAEWTKLRMRVLTRDRFTCQMCGKIELDTSKLIGDHKRRHQGNRAMFFDETNVWCICKPCHDGAKQRQDKSSIVRGTDIDGRPMDPNHLWNAARG